MVTFVKSTYPGSKAKYAVSGVRVSCSPTEAGNNEIRLQLAGTELELDINVDYAVALSIQRSIDEANGIKEPINDVEHNIDFSNINSMVLIDELANRLSANYAE